MLGPQPQIGSSARSSSPPPDRLHPVEEVGVAGEVDAAAAREHEADRLASALEAPRRRRRWSASTAVIADAADVVATRPGASSGPSPKPRRARKSPRARRGEHRHLRPSRRSEGRSAWSWWRWEIRTASRSRRPRAASGRGPWRRSGPTRARSTGSVSRRGSVELEQDGRVADVGDPILVRSSALRHLCWAAMKRRMISPRADGAARGVRRPAAQRGRHRDRARRAERALRGARGCATSASRPGSWSGSPRRWSA